MHYEFMGTPAQARDFVEQLKHPPVPIRTPSAGVAPAHNPPWVLHPIITALFPAKDGLVLVADNGDTYAFGTADYPGPMPGQERQWDPPQVLEALVDDLPTPGLGMWLLAVSGAVYTYGDAPYLGGANGQDYFAGRHAARLFLSDAPEVPQDLRKPGGYVIQATSGEF